MRSFLSIRILSRRARPGKDATTLGIIFIAAITCASHLGCKGNASFSAFAQSSLSSRSLSNQTLPSFDITSIKPSKPETLMAVSMSSDSYRAKGATVKSLIYSAYNLKMPNLIYGLPSWASSQRFDIEAKIDEQKALALKARTEKEQIEQIQWMLQSLIFERFKMSANRETKELPVLSLTASKNGPTLKSSAPGDITNMMVSSDRITATGASIDDLAISLSDFLGRIVINRTGLKERYNFILEIKTDGSRDNLDIGSAIFTALQEQLGLQLTPSKAPVDVVVVDHIERPSPD